jgi:ribokinase
MSKASVVVVGSANVDLATRVADYPQAGQNVFGSSFGIYQGGKGANQAVAAARLGVHTSFLACVGEDPLGQDLLHSVKSVGVDCSHVRVTNETHTGTAAITVEESGRNTIIVTPGANSLLSTEDVEAAWDLFDGAGALLLQLEVPIPTVVAAIRQARRAGVKTILDAGPVWGGWDDGLYAADVISPNQEEASTIVGFEIKDLEGARKAASRLLARVSGAVVMKLGEQGCLVATESEMCHLSAIEVDVVDTTGAGDAFTAALAVAMAEGMSVHDAARMALAAGAAAVTVMGAGASMPTRAEVKALMG